MASEEAKKLAAVTAEIAHALSVIFNPNGSISQHDQAANAGHRVGMRLAEFLGEE